MNKRINESIHQFLFITHHSALITALGLVAQWKTERDFAKVEVARSNRAESIKNFYGVAELDRHESLKLAHAGSTPASVISQKADVAQTEAEAPVLETGECGFNSHRRHLRKTLARARVVQSAGEDRFKIRTVWVQTLPRALIFLNSRA